MATEAAEPLPERCVAGTNMLRYRLRPVAKQGLDEGALGGGGGEGGKHRCRQPATTTRSAMLARPAAAFFAPAASPTAIRHPGTLWGAEECPGPLDEAAVQEELRLARPEVAEAAEAAARTAAGPGAGSGRPVPACVASAGREELELTFLGTGAAIPSKYRNVTGGAGGAAGCGLGCGPRQARQNPGTTVTAGDGKAGLA